MPPDSTKITILRSVIVMRIIENSFLKVVALIVALVVFTAPSLNYLYAQNLNGGYYQTNGNGGENGGIGDDLNGPEDSESENEDENGSQEELGPEDEKGEEADDEEENDLDGNEEEDSEELEDLEDLEYMELQPLLIEALLSPADFSELQTAVGIDNTITLTGNITVPEGQSLIIESGRTITLEGTGTITGAVVGSVNENTYYPVILVRGGSTLTLDGPTVTRPSNGYGRGIRVENSTLNMHSGKIINNHTRPALPSSPTFRMDGGGVYLHSSTFTMTGGLIDNNGVNAETGASLGGGVFVDASSTFIMTEGTISRNLASQGGGIYNLGTLNLLDDAIVTNNTAANGGGVYNSLDGTFTIDNDVEISDNYANARRLSGGGVYNMGTFTMRGQSRIDNNIGAMEGGGVVNTGIFNMESGTILRNDAYAGGGVYLASNARFNKTGGLIQNNHARENGGGVYITGAAVFKWTSGEISSNEAANGGGIYMDSPNTTFNMKAGAANRLNTARLDGGGLFVTTVPVLEGVTIVALSDGQFFGNRAQSYDEATPPHLLRFVTGPDATILNTFWSAIPGGGRFTQGFNNYDINMPFGAVTGPPPTIPRRYRITYRWMEPVPGNSSVQFRDIVSRTLGIRFEVPPNFNDFPASYMSDDSVINLPMSNTIIADGVPREFIGHFNLGSINGPKIEPGQPFDLAQNGVSGDVVIYARFTLPVGVNPPQVALEKYNIEYRWVLIDGGGNEIGIIVDDAGNIRRPDNFTEGNFPTGYRPIYVEDPGILLAYPNFADLDLSFDGFRLDALKVQPPGSVRGEPLFGNQIDGWTIPSTFGTLPNTASLTGNLVVTGRFHYTDTRPETQYSITYRWVDMGGNALSEIPRNIGVFATSYATGGEMIPLVRPIMPMEFVEFRFRYQDGTTIVGRPNIPEEDVTSSIESIEWKTPSDGGNLIIYGVFDISNWARFRISYEFWLLYFDGDDNNPDWHKIDALPENYADYVVVYIPFGMLPLELDDNLTFSNAVLAKLGLSEHPHFVGFFADFPALRGHYSEDGLPFDQGYVAGQYTALSEIPIFINPYVTGDINVVALLSTIELPAPPGGGGGGGSLIPPRPIAPITPPVATLPEPPLIESEGENDNLPFDLGQESPLTGYTGLYGEYMPIAEDIPTIARVNPQTLDEISLLSLAVSTAGIIAVFSAVCIVVSKRKNSIYKNLASRKRKFDKEDFLKY